MWGKRIEVDRDLYERLRRCAASAGYSSVAELVRHALEQEVERLEKDENREEIDRRLRGLGYLS
ncbi:MAG: ribbon-helix-helix protein, CopG family [Candidatus Latescibacterota bacterium]